VCRRCAGGLKPTTSLREASLRTDLRIFKSKDFNHYSFLTHIYSTYMILTGITIISNCYGMTMTQLTTFVPLYCCNNNITLKMAAIAAETCW